MNKWRMIAPSNIAATLLCLEHIEYLNHTSVKKLYDLFSNYIQENRCSYEQQESWGMILFHNIVKEALLTGRYTKEQLKEYGMKVDDYE